uniref:Uncharacterized protein n=1 Tax=Oryza glumipatula TaxID=40148 RepID=A0A0E0AIG1_9ORYZ
MAFLRAAAAAAAAAADLVRRVPHASLILYPALSPSPPPPPSTESFPDGPIAPGPVARNDIFAATLCRRHRHRRWPRPLIPVSSSSYDGSGARLPATVSLYSPLSSTSSGAGGDSTPPHQSPPAPPPPPSWVDRWVPLAARPYAMLARIDKPIGTWLLAWPSFWYYTTLPP